MNDKTFGMIVLLILVIAAIYAPALGIQITDKGWNVVSNVVTGIFGLITGVAIGRYIEK